MTNTTHEALKQLAAQLESLERVMLACDHTPTRHARRCGEIGREIGALAAANAAQDGVPTDLQQQLANARYVVRMKDDYIAHLESQLSTARAEGFEQAKGMAAKVCDIATWPGIANAVRALQRPDQPAEAKGEQQ